ncbi:hypothetical protein OsI_22499 [Oryza sativa Indica Group]|uniref:Uncharacterized protein n=1 Tax=Oryza sativa subsp. indica TaxID=39946 RepID=A2YBL6_ORYSI|nr:hypothetical protein OsI_22499 [Oryza sativa Indica Group]
MALGPKRGAALSLARGRRGDARRAAPRGTLADEEWRGSGIAMAGSRFQLARQAATRRAVAQAGGVSKRQGRRWEGRGRVERVKQPEDVDPASPPATEKSWRQWVDGARDDVALVLRPV